MNNTLQLLGIGALVLLLTRRAGAAIANRISIGQVSMRVDQLDLQFLKARLYIPVQNRTPVSIPIDWFRGQLFYADRAMADVGFAQSITIEGNQTTELEIRVQIPLWQAASNIVDLILNKQYLNRFFVRGNISSNGVIFPVNQNIQIL